MGTMKRIVKKAIGEMGFNTSGGVINWFPGHMASATRAIRSRLKLVDLVIEVRDSRIPLSSANADLQPQIAGKRRIIALNKKDLANPNILNKWVHFFDSSNQDCLPMNAHNQSSVKKLLDLVEFKLKEVISREPTLLVMVVGVPNVGKSALINSIHRIASARFPVEQKIKRATVGPLPGVTQDIAGYKIAHKPSIYVQDTPGVLVPSIPDVETGLKLALVYHNPIGAGFDTKRKNPIQILLALGKHYWTPGSVKDSVVGEERIAQYLLAVLNTRSTPLHWKQSNNRRMEGITYESTKHEYNLIDLRSNRKKRPNTSDVYYIEDLVTEVQRALYTSLSQFNGNIEDEDDLECLIEQQFELLQKAMKIPHKASEARLMVSKKLLTLFRTGKLGPFILDDVPQVSTLSHD